ncbi:MAG: septum site-determining protein Ssd, partial [Ornithinimicrobium sp.]
MTVQIVPGRVAGMLQHGATPNPVRSDSPPGSVVIGVIGATGGVGVSAMASALAVRSAARGHSTVLIDGDSYGGGLDIMLGLDLSPGLRWPDLSAAQGELDGAAILSALPALPGCHVLSWGRSPGSAGENGPGVCAAVSAEVDVSVLDLPSLRGSHAHAWSAMCDHIVVLCGSGVRPLASAAVVLEALERADPTPDAPRILGVLRQSHRNSMDIDTASALLGIPLVATIEFDRWIEVALCRGEAVGMRMSPLARACDRVLA